MRRPIGYCTNCHPGVGFDDLLANLTGPVADVALRAAAARPEAGPLPAGLWLPAPLAAHLRRTPAACDRLAATLDAAGLTVDSFNAFPADNFHAPVLKAAVYRPAWSEAARLAFTCDVAEVAARLVPAGRHASISTVPLGWPEADAAETGVPRVHAGEHVRHLIQAAEHLDALSERSGIDLHLDLEPEPGCILGTIDAALAFLNDTLFAASHKDLIRRRIGVCFDVCHAAVVREHVADALDAIAAAGVRLGKVQLSAAPAIDFDRVNPDEGQRFAEAIRGLVEPRFLHQTTISQTSGVHAFTDLPEAIAAAGPADARWRGQWAIHFHVPLDRPTFRGLPTSRAGVAEALAHPLLTRDDPILEVETYTHPLIGEASEIPRIIAAEIAWAERQPRHADGNRPQTSGVQA